MKDNKFLFFKVILLSPMFLLASDGGILESDFFYRVFNFSIFIYILYYLTFNPIKDFFINREKSIENKLKSVRNNLLDSKNNYKKAQALLVKNQNKVILNRQEAEERAKYMQVKIAQENINYLSQLELQFDKNIKIDKNKIVKKIIFDLLDSGIESSDIEIKNSQIVAQIYEKKR